MALTFNERLTKALMKIDDTNCIGTALYLTGILERDRQIDGTRAYNQYLSRLQISKEPEPGFLVSWEMEVLRERSVHHLGVITSLSPLLVTNRKCCDGDVSVNDTIKEIRKFYRPAEERFYVPPQNLFVLDGSTIKVENSLLAKRVARPWADMLD